MATIISNVILPAQVYFPAATAPSGTPHCWLFNQGPSTVYIGGPKVTPFSGIPLPPNTEIKIPNAFSPLYAVAGFTISGTSTTIATTAVAAGATTATLAAAAQGFVVVSSTATLANGGELVQNTSATTAAAFTPALSYDHQLGGFVTLVTVAPGILHTEASGT